MMKNRLTMVAGLLSGAVMLLATAPAFARTDVSVNIGVPGYYVQPAPVYYEPAPVYYEPPPPVYVQPRRVYVQPQPYYVEREYRQDWRERRWNRDHRSRHDHDRGRDWDGGRYNRDRDGDGVPNRFDRRPNNPYRN